MKSEPVTVEQREQDLAQALVELDICSEAWFDARVMHGARRPAKFDNELTEAIQAVRRADRKLAATRRRNGR